MAAVTTSGSSKGGCGFAIVAIIIIALAVAVLRAVWWLLLIAAIALAGGAFAIRRKDSDEKPEKESKDEPFYTQRCPNCNGQIEVNIYDSLARCQYCNSIFPAEQEPVERPAEETPKRFFYSTFQMLIALSIALAILGVIGFGLSMTDTTASSDVSQSTVSSAEPEA